MNFEQHDARTAADSAKPLHLRNPVDGKKMYSDNKQKKPCLVMVRGTESRIVQTRLSELRKERAIEEAGSKKDQAAIQGVQDQHENLSGNMHPLITGFENIEKGTKALDATSPEDVTWFLNLQLVNSQIDGDGNDLSFLGQVAKFATERGNYLGNSKGD